MKPLPFLAIILFAATLFAIEVRAEIPARNLDFETWSADGKPKGWGIGSSPAHTMSADCESAREGKCSLKIEGRPQTPPGFLPLGQQMPPGDAAGHRLKLSGFIRTLDVKDGWAGLWIRVDASAGTSLALENMAKDGPRGTTDWQRFEISALVPPNASNVAFGVLLSGSGTAWFDDLKLAVDDSVTVPPRPQPSLGLTDDSSLELAPADARKVRDDWRADVRERAHPIRSLFSDRFDDLQFLKPLLKDKRVVQLGESGHGVAEFNWMKVRLVKFLHQEMGFDVVAFESSMSGCDVADSRIGKAPPMEVMRDCIFRVWHSSETLGLFEYMDSARKEGKRISLAGFDVQNSGLARAAVASRLEKYAALVDAGLAEKVASSEKKLAAGYGKGGIPGDDAAAMMDVYRSMAKRLAAGREKLLEIPATPPDELDMVTQEARSRVRFVEELSKPGAVEGLRARDLGMADNLDFLLDTVFPRRKVIVWAHNFHIAKQQDGAAEPRTMGAWVAQRRAAEVYTIGLYMGRGVATTNDRARYEIKPPPDNSMEAILASAGWKMSFVELSGARTDSNSWMYEPITAREWGTTAARIVPARTYDAVIYIDTVTPPDYR